MTQVKLLLPLGLLSALIVRSLIHGATLPEMGIETALVGLLMVKEFLEKQKAIGEVRDAVTKELAEVRGIVHQQNLVIEKMALALDENRNAVTSLKLSNGMSTRKIG